VGVVLVALLGTISAAWGSDVDVAVVDTTAPTGSVTLAPGATGQITINLSVSGAQAGTATFEVYKSWTLSNGVFTGSNPEELTVGPRAGGAPATTFSRTGSLTVDCAQPTSATPTVLRVEAFDITNSNATGAKLVVGDPSSYSVTVSGPPASSCDSTPPQIGYVLDPSTPNGSNGWYKSGSVSLTWTVSEPETPGSLVKTGCVDQTVAGDQLATTYSCSATSAGGSAGPVDVSLKRDATAPTVTLSGGPTHNATYYEGEPIPAAPTCDATDVTSGVNGVCTVSGYGTSIGTHDVTASATDLAGNVGTSSTLTYTVLDDTTPPAISADLDPDDPDGTNQWYTSDVSLTWSAFEDQTPASLQKTGCVDQSITADQASTSYSCSATSLGGSAGPVTVSIKRDATDPEVTLVPGVGGLVDGEQYYEGEVPGAPTCDATDDLSGVNGVCAVSGYGTEIGTYTVKASASDLAGNGAESTTITYEVLDDTSPPEITKVVTPATPDGDSGWYVSDVTVDWTVTELETPSSLVVTGCDDQSITLDQLETTYECSATSLGGSAEEQSVAIKRDATAPTISGAVEPNPKDGTNGWYKTQPTVTFSCDDDLSGVDTCLVDGGSSSSVTLGDGEDQSVSGTATDEAGNTASVTVPDLDVDTVKPTVDITAPTSTAAASVTVGGAYADATSGVTGVTVDGTSATVTGGGASGTFELASVSLACGANTVTATATDEAGHTESDSESIYRRCFTGAFQHPLDANGVLNKAKLGRVVPVKLAITANDGGAVPTPVYFGFKRVPCTTGAATDEVETYLAAGSSNVGNTFRLSDGVWIYNLDTSKLPGAAVNVCYQLDVYAGGSFDSAGIASAGVALQNGTVRIQLTK
jgi:hypothetical protein